MVRKLLKRSTHQAKRHIVMGGKKKTTLSMTFLELDLDFKAVNGTTTKSQRKGCGGAGVDFDTSQGYSVCKQIVRVGGPG